MDKSTTDNLITTFMLSVGESETPQPLFYWSMISTIATVLGPNVWVSRWTGDLLYPNLYVMLIGPSGCGKGTALNRAHKYITPYKDDVGYYRGKISPWALSKKIAEHSRFSYVTPELAAAIPAGAYGRDIIKMLTDLYEGGGTHGQYSLTNGATQFSDPTVNWLAGTIVEWLLETVDQSAILSGFFARVTVVNVPYRDKRMVEPRLPDDVRELRRAVHVYLARVANLFGQMSLTMDAKRIMEQWYTSRPAPDDPALVPSFKREWDLAHKLAMVHAAARGTMAISTVDVVNAQNDIAEINAWLPRIIDMAFTDRQGATIVHTVGEIIRSAGKIQHRALLQKLSPKGVRAAQLHECIIQLENSGLIRRESHAKPKKKPATYYIWKNLTGSLTAVG